MQYTLQKETGADICIGENHLSFIETSALDASNVELAFQNILTGTGPFHAHFLLATLTAHHLLQRSTESYRARSSIAGTEPKPPSGQEPTSP